MRRAARTAGSPALLFFAGHADTDAEELILIPEAGPVTGLLSEAVRTVFEAASLDEGLRRLAGVLRERYGLWRASFLGFSSDGEHVRIKAVWSGGDTVLESGSDIAVRLTPATHTMVLALRRGRPATFRTRDVDMGILSDVLRNEGLESWLGLPLRAAGEVKGALSFASSMPEAFGDVDLLFFDGLAAGIEGKLLELCATGR